mmetsp:Transcript_13875/g.28051  ORF Transcript_13875/g.28051 Transcript_13875/m.28051 type:complete len:215 (-) Transcript_13875:315-959(-)
MAGAINMCHLLKKERSKKPSYQLPLCRSKISFHRQRYTTMSTTSQSRVHPTTGYCHSLYHHLASLVFTSTFKTNTPFLCRFIKTRTSLLLESLKLLGLIGQLGGLLSRLLGSLGLGIIGGSLLLLQFLHPLLLCLHLLLKFLGFLLGSLLLLLGLLGRLLISLGLLLSSNLLLLLVLLGCSGKLGLGLIHGLLSTGNGGVGGGCLGIGSRQGLG